MLMMVLMLGCVDSEHQLLSVIVKQKKIATASRTNFANISMGAMRIDSLLFHHYLHTCAHANSQPNEPDLTADCPQKTRVACNTRARMMYIWQIISWCAPRLMLLLNAGPPPPYSLSLTEPTRTKHTIQWKGREDNTYLLLECGVQKIVKLIE